MRVLVVDDQQLIRDGIASLLSIQEGIEVIGAAVSAANPPDLSERELEVLRLIAQGATNGEIARHLVISERTVKNHISYMLGRLGLRDRTQAAIYAREHGVL